MSYSTFFRDNFSKGSESCRFDSSICDIILSPMNYLWSILFKARRIWFYSEIVLEDGYFYLSSRAMGEYLYEDEVKNIKKGVIERSICSELSIY